MAAFVAYRRRKIRLPTPGATDGKGCAPEGRGPVRLRFSGAKRPIFRSKAVIFRSNSAEIARRCRVGLEIPAESGTRQFAPWLRRPATQDSVRKCPLADVIFTDAADHPTPRPAGCRNPPMTNSSSVIRFSIGYERPVYQSTWGNATMADADPGTTTRTPILRALEAALLLRPVWDDADDDPPGPPHPAGPHGAPPRSGRAAPRSAGPAAWRDPAEPCSRRSPPPRTPWPASTRRRKPRRPRCAAG